MQNKLQQPVDRLLCLGKPKNHGMQRGLVTRKLSVLPSVKRLNCDKKEERSVQIFIPYERSFSLVL